MNETVRQLRALLVLQYRAWSRVMAPGRPAAEARSRRLLNLSLRLFFLALLGFIGGFMGRQAVDHARPLAGAVAWDLVGVAFMSMGQGFMTELPLPQQRGLLLLGPVLEPLPVSLGARLTAAVVQPAAFLVFWAPLFLVLTGGPGVLVLLVPFWVAAVLWGIALGKALRTILPAPRVAKLGWIGILTLVLGIQLPNSVMLLAKVRCPIPLVAWTARAALAHDAVRLGASALGAALVGALAVLLLSRAERVSFDRVGALTPGRVARLAKQRLDMAGVERLLARREPTRWMGRLVWVLVVLFSGFFVFAARGPRVSAEDLDMLGSGFALPILQFAFLLATIGASRAVARDVLARPLLGGLPVTPKDTLAGKARHLRRQILPLALPFVIALLVAGPGVALHAKMLWRAPAILLALALYAEASVAVAFLTTGLGAPGGGGALRSLDTFLVAVPFLGAALGPTLLASALSLACLAAVTFEARRSARRALSWVDDPEEARETPTWRVLLVLAGFMVTESLAGSLLALFLPPEIAASVAYVLAALVLALLTLQGRPRPAPAPVGVGALALGFAGGLLTGGAGLGYLAILRSHGVLEEVPVPPLAFGVVAVVAAPLAEELFFRGWLQPTIAGELPARRVGWAPMITALVFAAAHPPLSFLPVLMLGLVTGVLFARTKTIHAGVLAHVAHNAVAVGIPVVISRFV
jgi:membrane protease YdiL (CAAX protease family)